MDDESFTRFRDLYDAVMNYKRYHPYWDVLHPRVDSARRILNATSPFWAYRPDFPIGRTELGLLWSLYALSRVNDWLLLSFQAKTEFLREGDRVTRDEYVTFFSALGFDVVERESFHPFHHEVVEVLPSADPDEPIGIVEFVWPGLMLKELLFARAGVRVIGGSRHIVKEVAENSTLYFTYRRATRNTNDRSIGWGSNSQWSTELRLDYETRDLRVYNALGKNRLNDATSAEPDGNGLTAQERLELCRNRYFLTTTKDSRDLWPYDDRFEEPRDS